MNNQMQRKAEASADFAIYGMTCASCAASIERRLACEPGVIRAAVNLGTERASVRYNPGIASPTTIAAAVTDAGYRAAALSDAQDGQSQRETQDREANAAWWWFAAAALPATLILLLSMVFTG